jgi:error-prone DNA polymerase
MKGYSRLCTLLTARTLQDDFSLRRALLSDAGTADYFIITSDEALLTHAATGQLPHVRTAIHVLQKNYHLHYRQALSRNVAPVLYYPVVFAHSADYPLHRLVRAVHLCKKISSLEPEDCAPTRAHFFPPAELQSRYASIPLAFSGAQQLAEEACFDFTMGRTIFPAWKTASAVDTVPDSTDENSFTILRRRCLHNIPLRYGRRRKDIMNRLTRELSIIQQKGFADYFLVVEDIVSHGGRYTCGRGSGAASIVSYLLFITHVDPLAHDLYFERFLSISRTDPPDIDIDFAWDEKGPLTEYIFRRWGEHCALVSNHICFSVRSSLHEAARARGITQQEIMPITKNVHWYYDREKDDFIKYSETKTGESRWQEVMQDAVRLCGIPRFPGLHCGGVVITPGPIDRHVPLYRSNTGFHAIAWEKDQSEDFGLVKIDVLGNRSLAVARDTIRAIEQNYGTIIRYEHLNPLDDEAVIRTMAAGNTIGVFYVESPAMRQLQKKSSRGDYRHLVIHSSIIRPAANIFITEYLERLRGKPWKPLLAGMETILRDTYGIMVYQEDISKIAVRLGGLSEAEGDELRKIIGSHRKAARRRELRDKLAANLRLRGHAPPAIKALWDMMLSFAGYSFCKPHSASYALLSFKCCWLKINYPAEFMAAVISNQGGFYSPAAYLAEARRLQLRVLPPDINHSHWAYLGCRQTIYTGLMQIKGLKKQAVETLLNERQRSGAFISLHDFMTRCALNLADILLLVRAGCFTTLEPYNIPQLMFLARHFDRLRRLPGDSLLTYQNLSNVPPVKPPRLPDFSRHRSLQNEITNFGFIISEHPMKYFRQALPAHVLAGTATSRDIASHHQKRLRICAVFVTSKSVMTKNDEIMKFVSFEDEYNLFECVMFPDTYQRCGRLLEPLRPYLVSGRVDVEFDVPIVNILDVSPAGKASKP